MAAQGSPNKYNHLFVSGNMRSGTTLLQLILSAHSDICISPETRVISELIKRYPYASIIKGEELNFVQQLILSDPKIKSWRIPLQQYYEEVSNYKQITIHQVIEHLLLYFAKSVKPDAKWIGNKKGFYLKKHGEMIKQLFPASRFIFIVRDCRAVVASVIRTFGRNDIDEIARKWVTHIANGKKLIAQFPNDILEIKYENLTFYPEKTCRKMCSFLQIEYQAEMLEKYMWESAFRLKDIEIHPNTYKKINIEINEKWKTDLNDKQVEKIKNIAGNVLAEYGYSEPFL